MSRVVPGTMPYEMLVRGAFTLKLGRPIGRHEDPARLANEDILGWRDLTMAKAGASYAMAIYIREYAEKNPGTSLDVSDRQWALVQHVLDATSPAEFLDRIETFKAEVVRVM